MVSCEMMVSCEIISTIYHQSYHLTCDLPSWWISSYDMVSCERQRLDEMVSCHLIPNMFSKVVLPAPLYMREMKSSSHQPSLSSPRSHQSHQTTTPISFNKDDVNYHLSSSLIISFFSKTRNELSHFSKSPYHLIKTPHRYNYKNIIYHLPSTITYFIGHVGQS